MVVWDERRFVMEEKRVILSGRLLRIKLQDIIVGDMLTMLAAYLPTRDKQDAVIESVWEQVESQVEDAEEAMLLIGDLNAELVDDVREGVRARTKADLCLQQLVDEYGYVDIGPGGPTFTRNSSSTRIDHVLADACVASRVAGARNLPGISEQDHRMIEVDIVCDAVAAEVLRRPRKLRLWQLDRHAWADYSTRLQEDQDFQEAR